jgi:hypothetical protein
LESKRDKSSWLVLYFENIQLIIQVNHLIYSLMKKGTNGGTALDHLYWDRWKMTGKGWKLF